MLAVALRGRMEAADTVQHLHSTHMRHWAQCSHCVPLQTAVVNYSKDAQRSKLVSTACTVPLLRTDGA